ncbi:MAG: hypothetical protein J5586_03090 [Clostridia bacterium]|nr:hypothetical protein [Clostridia bacterium]
MYGSGLTSENVGYRRDRADGLWILTLFVFLIGVYYIVAWENVKSFVPLGIILAFSSLLTIIRCRKIPTLLLLFSVIGYINISSAALDYFAMGSFSNNYQQALRLSESGLGYAKMFLLNTLVVSLFLTPRFLERAESGIDEKLRYKRDNSVLAILFLALTLFVCITQFNGGAGSGGYVSNNNPLYEYAILFFALGILFTGDSRTFKTLYFISGGVYILKSMIGGDRSSAFMAVLVFVVYYFYSRIKTSRMLVYSLAGVVVANIIAEVRNAAMSVNGLFKTLLQRSLLFFFSDTVSASFYSGVTIIEFTNCYEGSRSELFLKWVGSLFVGVSRETNIVALASKYNVNGGGGLYPAYFGFFGGFLGVIAGAVILGFIIRFVFAGGGGWRRVTQVIMIAMVFRWYLYSSVTLFRTILLNFNILYLACILFCSLVRSRPLR